MNTKFIFLAALLAWPAAAATDTPVFRESGRSQFVISDDYLAMARVAIGNTLMTTDPAAAVRWFRLAAEQGFPAGQHNLGHMIAQGRGVPQDDVEALRWYRLAADQGFADAQSALGDMCFFGRGVPQDDLEALRWYRLAAAQGNPNAQSNLGAMYAKGRGVERDLVQGYLWTSLADAQGHPEAEVNVIILASIMTPAQLAVARALAMEQRQHGS